MGDPVIQVELEPLEAAIGYRFANRTFLLRALTHSSHVHEHSQAGADSLGDNEQLEFLGDSILGFLISEALFTRFPDCPEGRLSKLRAHLVSAVFLHQVSRQLRLGEYLMLGRGEEMSGGRSKKTLLVDALEALIAAIYLDSGIETVRQFVHRFVIGHASGGNGISEDILDRPPADYKSALQELAQARRLPAPRYSIVKEQGPEHSKTFTIEVRIGREWTGQAQGYSKKSAAQNAARVLLGHLGEISAPEA